MTSSIIATEGKTIDFYDRPIFFEVEADGANGFAMLTDSSETEEHFAIFLFDDGLRKALHEDAIDLRSLCTHSQTRRYVSELCKDYIRGTNQFHIHPVETMSEDQIPDAGNFWSDYCDT